MSSHDSCVSASTGLMQVIASAATAGAATRELEESLRQMTSYIARVYARVYGHLPANDPATSPLMVVARDD